MSCPSLVIGDPDTFSSAMMVSSVTCTSLCLTISNVTGSTSTVVATAAPPLDAYEHARPVAPARSCDERPGKLDEHVGENLEELVTLGGRRLGRCAAIRLLEAHFLEFLQTLGDYLREIDRHVRQCGHLVLVHELGPVCEHERGLVAAGMTLAAAELLREPRRALLPRQVEIADDDAELPLDRVARAVQRLDVLGLEVVVDEDDVTESLTEQRTADIDDQGVQRLLGDVDRAGERPRVARDTETERRQDQAA